MTHEPATTARRRWPEQLISLLVLVAVVLVANAVYLTYSNPDPLLKRSGLTVTSPAPPVVTGFATIDPNDGFTTQALGVASVHQLLDGKVPLWNHDEGIGEPLAGGMQAASFFPFTWLMLLPNGVLIFHMVLELIAAIGTYLLLKRLRIAPWIAVTGGALFALNGEFAWLANAVVNPIAFLPWLIYGIEKARESQSILRARGWLIVGASVALSLLAGFPEVAFLDTLLAGAWALVRLPAVERKAAYLLSVVAGGALGVAVAAPLLVAFVDYLPNSWAGAHNGGFAGTSVPALGILSFALPYMLGPVWGLAGADSSGTIAAIWGNVGGYVTLGAAGVAVFGAVARRPPLGLRILLAAWTVFAVARVYGVPVIGRVFDLIPGVSSIAAYRYLPASVSLAVIVLACLGLQAIWQREGARWLRIVVAVVFGVGALALAALATLFVHRHAVVPHIDIWLAFFIVVTMIVIAAVVGALLGWRPARVALAPILVLEAIGMFVVPQFGATLRPAAVDTAPVSFLQQHLGDARFFGLGILQPNYGSYYGIASINENNLPVPKTWADYIGPKLDQLEGPVSFDGQYDADATDAVTPVSEFLRNLSNYEQLGVKYVVAGSEMITADQATKAGLTVAFSDATTKIYELPAPAPYLSAPGCDVQASNRDSVVVDCDGPATLTRRELAFPGWSAQVGGASATVGSSGIFQMVAVPAGRHTVSFHYWPRWFTPALGASAAAIVVGIVLLVLQRTVWSTGRVATAGGRRGRRANRGPSA
ncbi:hypothetical protein [Gryllotalpicola protaetiae]|uniref:YfhO family protein n=1 Tax=Gryllotalpicola protaetiae TaxID=2419771 RepID=A0A387BQC9_9MICO|nr:hypothetical protein [Gryllotalpicola protaetiae]AYG04274.1 hypothetical protein D7I44_12560 [Gryllotalpicola protaetiae]